MTRIALLAPLPKLRLRPSAEQLIPDEERHRYPALADDLAVIDTVLHPAFEELDTEALRAQNSHRLTRLIVIIGGTVATILGAVQAAFTSVSWPGIVEGVLAAILIGLTRYLTARGYGTRFLRSRLGAERLRAEAFRYLVRSDEYASAADPARALRIRVAKIRQEMQT